MSWYSATIWRPCRTSFGALCGVSIETGTGLGMPSGSRRTDAKGGYGAIHGGRVAGSGLSPGHGFGGFQRDSLPRGARRAVSPVSLVDTGTFVRAPPTRNSVGGPVWPSVDEPVSGDREGN